MLEIATIVYIVCGKPVDVDEICKFINKLPFRSYQSGEKSYRHFEVDLIDDGLASSLGDSIRDFLKHIDIIILTHNISISSFFDVAVYVKNTGGTGSLKVDENTICELQRFNSHLEFSFYPVGDEE
ncbi:hypothetical protein [Rhizobium sp. C4]|uniref:hypothetical protein n=1 Tax=Rhizobium sp. C4 TaxID=1349800 RepID=UPI001E55F4CA|nr:hypothetical protein [Rhizobium sp. C4]MCD2175032.1 hypothetical protein [Rhizobium sp. C4]